MKIRKIELEEHIVLDWEEMYGTDTIEWYEEYNQYLPYWVKYMPLEKRNAYLANIKHGEFNINQGN